MFCEITFPPGAVAAGTNIDLPSDAPPIDRVIDGEIFEGRAVDEGGTATYTIGPVATTPTKVDENTITLNVTTTAYTLLHLRYIAKGCNGQPASWK
jgi:hypothetical protein